MAARWLGPRLLAGAGDIALRPSKGLFAQWQGGTVFIADAFTRHRVPMADVVPLRPGHAPDTFIARLRDTAGGNAHAGPEVATREISRPQMS